MLTAQKNTKHHSQTSYQKKKRDSSVFIQPKLTIGKAGDKYEQEADRVADQIVAKKSQVEPTFFSPQNGIQAKKQGNTFFKSPVVKPIVPEVQLKSISTDFVKEKSIQKKEEDEVQTKKEETPQETLVQPKKEVEPKVDTNKGNIQSKSETPKVIPLNPKTEQTLQKKEEKEIQQKEEENKEQLLQKSTMANGNEDTSGLEQNLSSSKGGGSPLPKETKNTMESGFGADFSGVRVHTDSKAIQMNQQLGAQAFTHGNDIYFNRGKYDTASQGGQHLLAHELTHTVQQGAAIQRKPEISNTSSDVQLLPGFIASELNEYARYIPGYSLFTVIIQYNPILGIPVRRTANNIVEALLELVPVWGPILVNKLREYDALNTAFDWINGELARFNLTTSRIDDLINEAWEDMDFVRWDPFDFNVGVLVRTFTGLYNDVIAFADSLKDQILEFIKDAVVSPLVGFLEENSPTYKLATKVFGRKFPLEDPVEATTIEILEDFLILIGKETELEEMRNKGTLQETADWIDTQLGTFFSLLGRFSALFTRAWDAFSFENLSDVPNVFSGILTDFSDLLDDFLTFAAEVAEKVLELIKTSLLSWLNSFAADIPGFTLLTVIIRKNPLTDEAVARSVQNIIRGFMGLIPGGEARYQELVESGVIPRAAGQIEALIAELGISRAFIVQLFTDIWNSFSIDDLLDPMAAFDRVAAQFGEPISRLFQFVVKVVKILVNLLLEIMGIPPDMIGNIVANIMSAFEDIKRDPIGFLLNLMNAIKDGFVKFLNNIGTHLMNGMQTWLFGTLADAGVQMPEDLSIRSLLGMAMDVLGITVDNVLDRLAEKIGPERMEQIRSILDTLTGIWAFVKDVIERGPIAIWEYVQEKLSNLWDIIKNGIMGFIQEKVIQQAIGWLLSFLDVTGIMPIIRGVQTVFNAITSFIEKLREILGIVNSFVAGVADIARGNIQSAATFLETALADGIPVAISFLAKQLGLGDISEKISEMIEAAREKINEGIDWLIDKAMEAGTAFLSAIGLGGDTEEETGDEADESSLQLTTLDSEFKDDENHDHTVFFEVSSPTNIDLIVQSDPIKINDLISANLDKVSDENKEKLLLARTKKAELIQWIQDQTQDSGGENETTQTEEIKNEIQEKLDEIAQLLRDSDVLTLDVPPTNVTYSMSGGKASRVTAEPLTILSGNTTGASPGGLNIQGWELVVAYDYIFRETEGRWDSQNWIRFHMLHDGMHGPATLWNLIPAHTRDNRNRYLPLIEQPVLDEMNNTSVLYFDVSVSNYYTGVPDIYANHEKFQALPADKQRDYNNLYKNFPKDLLINAGHMDKNGESYERGTPIHPNVTFTFEEALDVARDPGSIKVILNKVGKDQLADLNISRGNQDYLTGNGRSTSSVSNLIDDYLNGSTLRTIGDCISILNQIKSALQQSNDAMTINLFEDSNNSSIINDINGYLQKLNEIKAEVPSSESLQTLKQTSKLTSNSAILSVYSTRAGQTIMLKGISFKIKELGSDRVIRQVLNGNYNVDSFVQTIYVVEEILNTNQ